MFLVVLICVVPVTIYSYGTFVILYLHIEYLITKVMKQDANESTTNQLIK
jgi:hypothetical protein